MSTHHNHKAKSAPIDEVYDPHGKLLMKRAFYWLIGNDSDWGRTDQRVLAQADVGQFLGDRRGQYAAGVRTGLPPCSAQKTACPKTQC